jgi:hydrogenase maturation protease
VNTPLVIGLGNDFRRDDGAGRIAARRVRELAGDTVHVVEESGEGAALMDTWRDAESRKPSSWPARSGSFRPG